MRLLRLAVPVAVLSLVAACGGDSTTTTPVATSPAPAPTTSSSAPTTSSSAGGQTLTGLVGEEGNPEAFKISLADSTGAPVKTLPAGTYKLTVKDQSAFHNFHLTGAGVEETTGDVKVKVDPEWTITLTAGTYTYKCDPHSNMVETFTVT